MKKIIFLLLIPAFCNANTPTVFKSSCGGIQYSIESFCSVNNLKGDQINLTYQFAASKFSSLVRKTMIYQSLQVL